MILALTQEPSAFWYFARASGFVSLVLLAATVCLGLAVTSRLRSPSWPSFVTEDLHRYLGTVLYLFLSIHVVTLLLDPFSKFSLADALVPFISTYRTFWMGLGVVAAELTLALGLSVHARGLIGYRAWRLMHYGTWVIFPMAALHGLVTGTDTLSWWGVGLYAGSVAAVLFMVVMRLGTGPAASGVMRSA
ncbi:MAG: hypothetical protein QOE92_1749 [Chloroflexota bacterium]|jgi:sulfoxide reductase heme-binding subunit YedZ|nr:hypothetical protein [Chloroflexota bacterium]